MKKQKTKKPKVLTFYDTQCGLGWIDADYATESLECPECGEEMELNEDDTVQCDNGHKFKIERGIVHMIKIGDLISTNNHISKQCKKCTNRDCGDYDDCKHGHNYVGGRT